MNYFLNRRALLALILVAASVGFAGAQSADLAARKEGMTQVQDNNRVMSAEEKDKAAKRNKEERMAVVNEAFKRLQILHNEMMTILSSSSSVDSKKLITIADEVKLRATQLNANLALPELPKEKTKDKAATETPAAVPAAPASTSDHLSKICEQIRDFVKNVNLSPTDPKAGMQARRDLISLVDKSDQLILSLNASAKS